MAPHQNLVMSDLDLQWLALGNAVSEPLDCATIALKIGLPANWSRIYSRIRGRFAKLFDKLQAVMPASVVLALRSSSAAEFTDRQEAIRVALERGDRAVVDLLESPLSRLAALLDEIDVAPDLRPQIKAAINVCRGMMREVPLDEQIRFKVGGDLKFPGSRTAAVAKASPLVEVWYGTNRTPVLTEGVLTGYSSERDVNVHLGHCSVEVPAMHAIGGNTSWWKRLIYGDEQLKLVDTVAQTPEDFWRDVGERLGALGADPKDAVVFLHGYNVSFEEAAICAAQIAGDLALPCMMAFFSWPSRGRLFGYTADEATIEASEKSIVAFLDDFCAKSGARRVHLIAHSMGNRGLMRAVQRIALRVGAGNKRPFGQIILAAPDVDLGVFRDLAGAYPIVADRTTLYVSAGDRAVLSSRILHAANRVGFVPPISIFTGIDTINVTNVDLTKLGHGYVASSRPVLSDMFNILINAAPPDKRATLRPKNDGSGNSYWEFAA